MKRIVTVIAALLGAAVIGLAILAIVSFEDFVVVVGWVFAAVSGLISLALSLFFLFLLVSPMFAYKIRSGLEELFSRLRSRRSEIWTLKSRISQLPKPYLYYQLGNIYFQQHKFKEAAEQYQHAVKKDSEMVDALYKLGCCMLKLKKHEDAAKALARVNELDPEHDYGGACLRLAEARQGQERYDEAEKIYARLLRYYPGNAEGRFNLGMLLDETGRRSEAREAMKEVVETVKTAPRFKYRQDKQWMRKAKWFLRTRR